MNAVARRCRTCGHEWEGTYLDPCERCLVEMLERGTAEAAERRRRYAVRIEVTPPTMRERFLSLEQVAAMPPLEPLVHDLLDLDSLVVIYGRRGAAKSFLAVDLLASIATGTRWHGRLVEHGPALYVVAEGVAGIGPRFDAWLATRGRQMPGADRLAMLPEPVNLLSPSTVGEFADAAAEFGTRLIVLDTLARCMVGGDENSAKDAGFAVEQLDVIRRRTGACVVVIHHSGKDSAAGARGSSAIEAAADTVLEVGTTDAVMTIKCTKQKNHPEPNMIQLQLRSVGPSAVLDDYRHQAEHLSAGELDTLAALAEIDLDAGVASGAWEAASPVRAATFFRYRKKLVTLGLVSNVGTDKQPRYQVSDAGTLALSQDSQR